MKKIKIPEHFYRFSPIRCYWNLLEEIVEIIDDENTTVIQSGKFEYKNLKELKGVYSKRGFISDVKIIGKHGAIIITIEQRYLSVDNNPEFANKAARIKELLAKSSPWYMFSSTSQVWYALNGLISSLTFLGLVMVFFLSYKGFFSKCFGILSMIFGSFILYWSIFDSPILTKTKIYTSLEKERLNFWERNKDAIFKNLLNSLLGFLVGYFLAKIN